MAVTAYEIPLIAASQTLTVTLGGKPYQLRVLWNAASYCWVLDISDAAGTAIVLGIALVTGVNLLGQFAYLGFAGALEVQTDYDTLAIPTLENLGSTGHLYFVVAD